MNNRNVNDLYKAWTEDLIREDLKKRSFNFAVLMENFVGDFNIGSVLRSCNAFGGKEMYYYGRKHYDRRGTVGTHHYTPMLHLHTHEDLLALKDKYTFVALENTVKTAESLDTFVWPNNPLIIVGEEGVGITSDMLSLCDRFVYIEQYGSVRSLNAAVASSIAMNHFVSQTVSVRKKPINYLL
jgi:tRNA G18 (ribose-2'-O)-methylase SpoU